MSVLLKNVVVTDLNSPHHNKRKDILIKNGLIDSFGGSAKRVIDCKGLQVTPGWFDLNAHFCDPGLEHKEDLGSGSGSAAHGGFTDVNLIPSTQPPIQTKGDVEYLLSKGNKEVTIHISAGLSEGLKGENLTEILDLVNAGARSFSEGDHPIWNSQLLLKALQYTSQADVPVFQNARDPYLSENAQMNEGQFSTNLGLRGEPSLSEELTINRDLQILRYSGGRLHFTQLSSADSVELIKKAKKEGLQVTCDVSIHHLLYTDTDVSDFNTTYKSLPPFRSEKDRKALIKGVRDGVIDAISSGHRPQDQESKQLEFDLADPGQIALQTFYPSLLAIKDVPFDVLSDRSGNGARKVLGLEPVVIEKGAPAKLTILDSKAKWTLDSSSNQSKSANSPYWNQPLTGKVFGTVNGEVVSIFN